MKVVLLRHGECLGNVDESAYTRIPDHALPLTAHGEAQATAAGPRIKELVGDARLGVYVSPYRRTLHTLALLGLDPAWTVQEPRLREQDWGNLQDAEGQRRQREERDFFGHFFYRLPNGESGADVDDRIAAFLTELRLGPARTPSALLVVTHGLAMRLLARRALGWSVALFESLSNPEPLRGPGAHPRRHPLVPRPPVRAVDDPRRRHAPGPQAPLRTLLPHFAPRRRGAKKPKGCEVPPWGSAAVEHLARPGLAAAQLGQRLPVAAAQVGPRLADVAELPRRAREHRPEQLAGRGGGR